jgi:hypothetical protein
MNTLRGLQVATAITLFSFFYGALADDVLRPRSANPQPIPAGKSAPQPFTPVKRLSATTVPDDAIREVRSFGVARLGEKIYTTGEGDVIITVLPKSTTIPGNRLYVCLTNDFAALTNANLPVAKREKFVYANDTTPDRTTINLGRLPRGEIIFKITCGLGIGSFYSGSADRNRDGKFHVSVLVLSPGQTAMIGGRVPALPGTGKPGNATKPLRDLGPGEIAMGFEDSVNMDDDFDDMNFKISGDVTLDTAVLDLLKVYTEQTGEVKKAAGVALAKMDPRLAASVGIRPE